MTDVIAQAPTLNDASVAAATESATTTVVKNDTPAKPSIKVDAQGRSANIVVVSNSDHTNSLAVMEQARKTWETTELAASNKRLYSILCEAYRFYMVMKQHTDKGVRSARVQEMEQFIKERKYGFTASTHDMTRVVKCVFGEVDRRRVSAYSIALRAALRQEVAVENLVAFLEANGGVEQIRLGGSKPLSVATRAGMVVEEVRNNDLAKIKFEASLFAADSDWVDKQVVIVATYLHTGEFVANTVVRHDGAVNAALAAHYSLQQSKQREAMKGNREQEKAEATAAKAEAAAREAAEKVKKQKAVVTARKLTQAQKTAIAAQADALFEVVRN